MRLFGQYLFTETRRCVEQSIRINVIGRRDRLSDSLLRSIEQSERLSASGAGMLLRIAVDYSSQYSIVEAARRAGRDADLNDEAFVRALHEVDHSAYPAGEVDLLIRTGSEQQAQRLHAVGVRLCRAVFHRVSLAGFRRTAFPPRARRLSPGASAASAHSSARRARAARSAHDQSGRAGCVTLNGTARPGHRSAPGAAARGRRRRPGRCRSIRAAAGRAARHAAERLARGDRPQRSRAGRHGRNEFPGGRQGDAAGLSGDGARTGAHGISRLRRHERRSDGRHLRAARRR